MPVSPSSEGQMTATTTPTTTPTTPTTAPTSEVCNNLPEATPSILTYSPDVRELLTRCNLSTIAYSSGVLSSFPTPTGGPGAPGGSGGPVVVTSGTAAITLAPPTPTGGNGQGGNGQGGNNNLPQPVAQGGAPAQTATIGAALALGAFGMVMALL